ncbi:MAG: type VI secretion system contractile sheath large subunit [Stellaceae bacterium]
MAGGGSIAAGVEAESPELPVVAVEGEVLNLEFQRAWLQQRRPPDGVWRRGALRSALDNEIAEIDRLISDQVNAILHHPRFQKLEASWRGIEFLLHANRDTGNIKVRVLNVTWEELCRDLERAIEFDRSQAFQKIYGAEFDMPGGRPYGLLIGDYEVHHRRTAQSRFDDFAALHAMAQVAAAAFSPFIVGASPEFFEFDSFADMTHSVDLAASFRSPEYARWHSLRNGDDARFVGVTLPHILMRLPYTDDGSRMDGFRFVETVRDATSYLWGNSVYAFAAVAVRAYAESGWFTDIRGARRSGPQGGKVEGLPIPGFDTDRPGLIKRFSTDVSLSEAQEKQLNDMGFIPLLNVQYTGLSAFYSNPSIQTPKVFTTPNATANALLSTMLQYILSVSRFAHYVKILARDRIGSFGTPEECEQFLSGWLRTYCNSSDQASPESMARYPLRDAAVQVREQPGHPGLYQCTIHLRPHSQADQIVSEFRLVTMLPAGQTAG